MKNERDILRAFNFCFGIQLKGYDLTEGEQKILGYVRSRQKQHEGQYEFVRIGYKELNSLIGYHAEQTAAECVESLKEKGLLRVGKYNPKEHCRDFILGRKANELLAKKKTHKLVRYPRKSRVTVPKKELGLKLGCRFERIGLHPSVIELLDQKLSPTDLNTIANDVWRIIGGQHYCKMTKTGRESNLLNGIKTELRLYTTYEGELLAESDVSSCHPKLLYWYYREFNLCPKEAAEYRKLCVSNRDFYAVIFKNIEGRDFKGKERDRFKKSWNTYVNGGDCDKVKDAMQASFPVLCAKIEELNQIVTDGKKGENARILQGLESSGFVAIGNELAREWDRPYFSIHDGFMCRDKDFKGFKEAINRHFEKLLGFKLKIRKEGEKEPVEEAPQEPESVEFQPEQPPKSKPPKEISGPKTKENIVNEYQKTRVILQRNEYNFDYYDEEEYVDIMTKAGLVQYHPKSTTAKYEGKYFNIELEQLIKDFPPDPENLVNFPPEQPKAKKVEPQETEQERKIREWKEEHARKCEEGRMALGL